MAWTVNKRARSGILPRLPFVEEIYGLGMCQGGSTIASAARTDHRIKTIAMVSGMMAADALRWTDHNLANQQIAAANASMQKTYESGEQDCVVPLGLTDEISKEELIEATSTPLGGETYDYYGRDGVRGPVAVKNYTNIHIGDQAMQSLFSIGAAYADKIVQPSLTIDGPSSYTAICSTKFAKKLTNQHEELAFDQFSHVDFCYKPQTVKASTDAVAAIFNE